MNIFWLTIPEKLVYAASVVISRLINGQKDLGNISYKKILCIKLDEIGDLCYSLHVIDMLKTQFPDAELTLLCKPFAITLTNSNPYINHITSNWADLTDDYDLIVDLRGNWKSNFYALRVWPKSRLDRGTIRLKNKMAKSHPHEVITNLQVVEPVIKEQNRQTNPKIYFGASELKKISDFLVDNAITRFAVLHSCARKSLRQWDKFDLLARYLKSEKGLDIVFIGNHGEADEIATLQKKIPFETFSTAGLFNLVELAALCSKAQLYVGNESGPLHIASVCHVPTLGLFGPGEPHVFYPWGSNAAYLHHVLSCNPCDQVHCVQPHNPCIKQIELTEVLNKIEKLLV